MSCERGNGSRTRSQKHLNKTKFKNDLHDTSHTTKFINSLEINNVCSRCKEIIEWKIKYKKYKPLKSPSTCVKCHGKKIKHAYHTLCTDCSFQQKVCPKCGKDFQDSPPVVNENQVLSNPEIQSMVKSLPERKRRTFNRFLNSEMSSDSSSEEKIINKLKELMMSSSGTKTSFDDYDEEDSFDSEDDTI